MKSQESNIKNLVFEGAGIRGLAYAGVIQEFEERGLIAEIENVGGTSAGAITAMMIAIGYQSKEIEKIISTSNFNTFNDGKGIFFGGSYRLIKRYGWYRGEKFTHWISKLIEAKTANANITFEELHKSEYKDLYITATNLTKQKLIILSYKTYPKMKVKDAVRISMSIPLYFTPIFMDSIGNLYKKQNRENSLDILLDGGITGNFPIFLFDSIVQQSDKTEKRIANPATVGIRIDTEHQIENDNKNKGLAALQINNFEDYISAFYIYVLENLNRNTLSQEDWKRTISVSSVGISPKIKRLSQAQKNKLIQSGRNGVNRFFQSKKKKL
jgi:NTE family protein